MQILDAVRDLDKSGIHWECRGINPGRWADGYIKLDSAARIQLETCP